MDDGTKFHQEHLGASPLSPRCVPSGAGHGTRVHTSARACCRRALPRELQVTTGLHLVKMDSGGVQKEGDSREPRLASQQPGQNSEESQQPSTETGLQLLVEACLSKQNDNAFKSFRPNILDI